MTTLSTLPPHTHTDIRARVRYLHSFLWWFLTYLLGLNIDWMTSNNGKRIESRVNIAQHIKMMDFQFDWIWCAMTLSNLLIHFRNLLLCTAIEKKDQALSCFILFHFSAWYFSVRLSRAKECSRVQNYFGHNPPFCWLLVFNLIAFVNWKWENGKINISIQFAHEL